MLEQMAKQQAGGPPMKEGPMPQKNTGPRGDNPEAQPIEQLDLDIATKLGEKLMAEGKGMDVIRTAVEQSGDPTQAISKFLVQMIMQIKDAVGSKGVELSPNIVLGQNGWVMNMLDLIEGDLGLPSGFSDDVFNDVMETFKALAQAEERGAQAPAQPAAGPQGGGLQAMGGAPAPTGGQPNGRPV